MTLMELNCDRRFATTTDIPFYFLYVFALYYIEANLHYKLTFFIVMASLVITTCTSII